MTEPLNDGLDFTYDSYVSQVPEALRGQIEPAFKAYSDQIKGKVEAQFGELKPFQEITAQGWTPEHVNVGLNLLQQLNDNPQQVFQALVQEYPDLVKTIQPEQNSPVPNQNQNSGNQTDFNTSPELLQRLDQQEKLLELLAQGYQQQQQTFQQQSQAEQEQAELAQFQKQLDQVAPENQFHRPFILSYIAQGQTPQEAVNSYKEWQTTEQQRNRSAGAPLIAPASGGGLPAEPVDTSKLTDPQRRSLIAQYLEAANQQG